MAVISPNQRVDYDANGVTAVVSQAEVELFKNRRHDPTSLRAPVSNAMSSRVIITEKNIHRRHLVDSVWAVYSHEIPCRKPFAIPKSQCDAAFIFGDLN